jgi:hypothetical protein
MSRLTLPEANAAVIAAVSRAADDMMREIAAVDPLSRDDCSVWCVFCGITETERRDPAKPKNHKPTCLWRRANESIASSEPITDNEHAKAVT